MKMLQCAKCGAVKPEQAFQYGKGKQYGQHPEHRYCPVCHNSIDWYGYKIVKTA